MKDSKPVNEKCPLACIQGYSAFPQEDEIDLRDLVKSLWQQRLNLLLSSALMFVVGALCLYLYPNVYEVTTYIERPPLSYIATNEESLTSKISPERMFARFYTLFRSENTWLEYKRSKNTQFDIEVEKEKFLNMQVINPELKKEDVSGAPIFLSISYQGNDSHNISLELKEYKEFVKEQVIQEFRKDFFGHQKQLIEKVQLEIDNLIAKYNLLHDEALSRLIIKNNEDIKKIKSEIEEAKEIALRKHRLALSSLEENLQLAQKIGLMKPTSITNFIQGDSEKNTIISTSNDIPLYLLGVEFLTTKIGILQEKNKEDIYGPAILSLEKDLNVLQKKLEIEFYKSRKNLIFIDGLPAAKYRLSRLKEIHLDWSQISVFNTLSSVQPEGEKIKPKMMLSLMLLVIISLFFGLVVVLIRLTVGEKK